MSSTLGTVFEYGRQGFRLTSVWENGLFMDSYVKRVFSRYLIQVDFGKFMLIIVS